MFGNVNSMYGNLPKYWKVQKIIGNNYCPGCYIIAVQHLDDSVPDTIIG